VVSKLYFLWVVRQVFSVINTEMMRLNTSNLFFPFGSMSTSSNTASAISVFNGEHYHIWVVNMRFYLRSQGLWNVVVSDSDPSPLTTNPTIA